MEKISGIIPGSARVSAVDLKEASPVRPGTPSFGRPEGVSSLKEAAMERAAETTARRSAGIHQNQMDWRSKETRQAAIAAEMSSRFFIKNRPAAEDTAGPEFETAPALSARVPQTSASTPAGFKTDDMGVMRVSSARPEIEFKASEKAIDEEPMLQQPEGLFPKGYFLNRTA